MLRELLFLAALACVFCQAPTKFQGTLEDLISNVFSNTSNGEDVISDIRTDRPPTTRHPVTNTPRTNPTTRYTTPRTTTRYTTPRTTTRYTTQRATTQRNAYPVTNSYTTEYTTEYTTRRPIDGPNPCEAGECTPYYLCSNGTIITDGEGILDVRIGAEDDPEPARHPCPMFFDTCCLVKGEEPNIRPVERHEGCGWRNSQGIAFQLKPRDGESQYGEFPWTIAVLNQEQSLGKTLNIYQCGGSLIHPSVVLTAAHCVVKKNIQSLVVRAGEWDTQTQDEPFPHQDRQVSEVYIHEQYKMSTQVNDIALLFLQSPVKLAENVNTVCLPPPESIFDNHRCLASGWGKNKFGKVGAYQVILKKIDLPIVPRDKCQASLRTTRLGKHFMLNPSFICAGGEPGKDTCTGDGGAPLVCEIAGRNQRYHQTGMVSWGIGCGDNHPGVYVNVPLFRRWIDKAFAMRKLDNRSYQV